jgi:uncharacterized protein (DUF58 family)
MQAALRNLYTWLFHLRGREREVLLVQRRIFLLPTRAGVTFAIVLFLMLIGSVNYNLSLGFILTFLLASLGLTGLLHTFRNVAGLRIAAARTEPVFAGGTALFAVSISNPGGRPRHSIGIARDKGESELIDIAAEGTSIAYASVPAPTRGLLRPGRLRIYSRFPLGLFYEWSYIELDTYCVVYPRPARRGIALPPLRPRASSGTRAGDAQEDFAGLREYRAGDSVRQIAWKAVARSNTLLTKQFAGPSTGELWLTLDVAPPSLPPEEKLSCLARWILDAHDAGLGYGIALPGVTISIGSGANQRDRCLEALAVFDANDIRSGT